MHGSRFPRNYLEFDLTGNSCGICLNAIMLPTHAIVAETTMEPTVEWMLHPNGITCRLTPSIQYLVSETSAVDINMNAIKTIICIATMKGMYLFGPSCVNENKNLCNYR